jgi:outer membrane protein OmpA-like peptidoglycan-associated protein
MKIAASILVIMLVALLAFGGYFYLKVHQPLAEDLVKFRSEQPQFEKMSRELKTRKDREARETAWIAPAADALRKGLSAAGIPADKTEIAVAGNRIVVNIAEMVLYTPQSVTFAKDGKPALDGLAETLKPFKDLEIVVGNVTEAAPAQGKGRKRVPAKDARSLSAGRSAELVKYLEKNGVAAGALVAAAYPAKVPDQGFRMKAGKTMIVIGRREPAFPAPAPAPAPALKAETKPTVTSQAAGTAQPAPKPEVKPAPAAQSTGTATPAPAPHSKPVPIPITPAPKKVP